MNWQHIRFWGLISCVVQSKADWQNDFVIFFLSILLNVINIGSMDALDDDTHTFECEK